MTLKVAMTGGALLPTVAPRVHPGLCSGRSGEQGGRMLGLSPSTAGVSILRRKRNLPLETFGEVKAIFNPSIESSLMCPEARYESLAKPQDTRASFPCRSLKNKAPHPGPPCRGASVQIGEADALPAPSRWPELCRL